MCPEFASGHLEQDWRDADRRQRNDRTSPARTNVRYGPERSRDIVHSRKWDNSRYRTDQLEDRGSRCSLRRKTYCNEDIDRRSRTERSASPSEYRRKERFSVTQRSRSPGRRKVFSGSGSYASRDMRNDSHLRRHTGNFSTRRTGSRERSPYRVPSSQLTTATVNVRPTEQDQCLDVNTRRSGDEPASRKYKATSRLNEEKARWSKYSIADVSAGGDRNVRETRMWSRRSVGQITDDCSTGREYSYMDRQSRDEAYDDIRHSRRLSSDRKVNYQDSCSFSSRGCLDSDDCQQSRTGVCDERVCRTDRLDVASSACATDRLNSKSYRHRKNEDWRTFAADRRKSFPQDTCKSEEDRSVSTRKPHGNSDRQHSSSRNDRRMSDNRNIDKSSSASSCEELTSKEQKMTEKYNETSLSCTAVDRFNPVIPGHLSDGHVAAQCIGKEESSVFQSQTAHVLTTDQCVVPATGDDKKQCFAEADSSCLLTGRKTEAVSSSSEYCVVTSRSAADGSVFLGSFAQPVIESRQQWIASSGPAGGIQLLRPQWPGMTVMAQRAANDHTTIQNFMPTAAVTQLPTKMSTSLDPRKLGVSGVLLNSNVNMCSLPSDSACNLLAVQPSGQYMMDSVYGDSPLLDEPSYHSPAVIHDPLQLVGSSVSSVDYTIAPVDDVALKKMLDVVTVAKTTLEQTLPAGCHVDAGSLKQQKVIEATQL